MQRMVEWVRGNKLTAVLLVVVGYLVWNGVEVGPVRPLQMATKSVGVSRSGLGMTSGSVANFAAPAMEMAAVDSDMAMPESMPVPQDPDDGIAPVASEERMVIRDTNMSLVVNDVRELVDKIQAEAESLGGYLVNSHLNVPEGAASGSITVRVPAEKRSEALEAFRSFGVRVVSENVNGRDVTDQYVDLEERLAVLEKTKRKFEAILDQAEEVSDLLRVQRELVSLQQQIDNLKGQQKYLEQSAALTRVTIYLSTDELALPYTPDEVWRPKVVVKEAVRSLIKTVRGGANGLIWLGVYSPIWVPVVGVAWFVGRKRSGKMTRG